MLSACPSVAGAEVSLRADVWGWAPSTVMHGMAKVPDSDSWTCPWLDEPLWTDPAAACRSHGQCGVPGTCTHRSRV